MTWHGIGNLRKPKHFIIPVSIIITGFVLGAVSGLMSVLFHQLRSLIWNDAYPLYFLALALIVPFLAKGWVDGTSES